MSELIWHPLALNRPLPPDSPSLLIQKSFSNSAYSIHVTDLNYIWGESLSRREIIQRALNDDTSIDPSEDSSQMKILLDKLKEALSVDNLCEDEDIEVEIGTNSDTRQPQPELQLKVICQLPSPLLPLIWVFKLRPLPQTELAKHLILPLLNLASLHVDEVTSLLTITKEKDLVIEKLKDALEETKIPIANIIGGGATRRRGLEAFDSEKWHRSMIQSARNAKQSDVVKAVFRSTGKKKVGDGWEFNKEWEEVTKKADQDTGSFIINWWEKVKNQPGRQIGKERGSKKIFEQEMSTENEDSPPDIPNPTASQFSKGKPKVHISPKRGNVSIADEEEDEFVVQRTPSPTTIEMKMAPMDEDETTDDGDFDAPIEKEAFKAQTSEISKKGLGKIGGKKTETTHRAAPPAPGRNINEPENGEDRPHQNSMFGELKGTVCGKKIGNIGGKIREPKPAHDEINQHQMELPSRIASGTPQVWNKTPIPAPKKVEANPTDEDEADRKRRQLRETLAAQQNAPVKKKRKF